MSISVNMSWLVSSAYCILPWVTSPNKISFVWFVKKVSLVVLIFLWVNYRTLCECDLYLLGRFIFWSIYGSIKKFYQCKQRQCSLKMIDRWNAIFEALFTKFSRHFPRTVAEKHLYTHYPKPTVNRPYVVTPPYLYPF